MHTDDDPVRNHLLSTAVILQRAIAELRVQVGEEAHAMTNAALRAGSMARTTTTLSLAGAMMISFDLIAPNGEIFNLGCMEFDVTPPTIN